MFRYLLFVVWLSFVFFYVWFLWFLQLKNEKKHEWISINFDDLWTGISLSLKEMQEWVRDWRVYPVLMVLSLALWVCQLVHHILKTTKSMLISVSQLWYTKSRLAFRSSTCFVRACTLQHWFNIGLQPCSWGPTVLQSLATTLIKHTWST